MVYNSILFNLLYTVNLIYITKCTLTCAGYFADN